MPIYEYVCKNDHEFERMLKFSEIDKRVHCPECNLAGKRKLVQDFLDKNSSKERKKDEPRSMRRTRFTNW